MLRLRQKLRTWRRRREWWPGWWRWWRRWRGWRARAEDTVVDLKAWLKTCKDGDDDNDDDVCILTLKPFVMDWVKMQHVAMLNQQSGNVTWRVPVGATDCQDDIKSWNQWRLLAWCHSWSMVIIAMMVTMVIIMVIRLRLLVCSHSWSIVVIAIMVTMAIILIHCHQMNVKITGLQSQLEQLVTSLGGLHSVLSKIYLWSMRQLLISSWIEFFYVSWCLFFLFGSKSWPDHKATIIMFLSLECVVSIVLARTWRLSICRRSPGKTALSTWCTCVKASDQYWRRTHQKGDRQGGGVTSLQPDGKHLWNVHPWSPLLPDRLTVMLTLFLAATRTSVVLFAHLQHIKHYNEIKSFELCFAFVFFRNTFPSRSGVQTGYRWKFLVADSKDFSKRSSTRSLSSATCLQTLALTVLSTQFYI